jgi:cysteine synthase A
VKFSANSVLDLIGNTPILQLRRISKKIYAKVERLNPTGSIKDRIAKEMISNVKAKHIVEATTGNTGISTAAIGASLGKKVTIVMLKGVSEERRKLIELLGAKVIFAKSVELAKKKAEKIARAKNGVFLNQFENELNFKAQYKTGLEIARTMNRIDFFVAAVGTGGTLSGIGSALSKKFKNIKIIGVVPAEKNHKIEGTGDGVETPLLEKVRIHKIVKVKSVDAIETARNIARKEGLPVGISSGANVFAAKQLKGIVVTVLPDNAERYFSTQLFKFGKSGGRHGT